MSIEHKLARGRKILSKAGNEPELLSPALTAIHGALEDACRGWLAAPEIKRQHGIDVLDNSQASWKVLLDLMEKHGGWSKNELRYVAKMNSLRNDTAHGNEFTGTYQQVEQYLQFVQKAIANGGELTSDSHRTSTAQHIRSNRHHFPRNRVKSAVTPFRFNIARTQHGVKLSNSQGAKVIGTPPNASSGNSGCRRLFLLVVFLLLSLGVILYGLVFIIDYESVLVKLRGVALILAVPAFWLYISKKYPQKSSVINSDVFVATDRVYIGKKSYPTPPGTNFGTTIQKTLNPEIPDLLKAYFVQPHGAVYFAHSLTWHEADELIRIVVNLDRVIKEQRSQVAISCKDNLIYVRSQHEYFVVSYSDKLWESLYCRASKQNSEATLIELTESEFQELCDRQLQEFQVS